MSQVPSRPWAGIPPSGPLMRPKEAANYLGYSRSAFYAAVQRGDIKLIKMGNGAGGASALPRPWADAIIAAKAAGEEFS
jgi:excisionase family DNA binding protein